MKTKMAADQDAELFLDGKKIMTGDITSMKVIFNNLAGINFQPDRTHPWQTGTHEEYLERMKADLGVTSWSGPLILHSNGINLAHHDFQKDSADHAPVLSRMRP